MKKIVLIPTEKQGKSNLKVLELVINRIKNQSSKVDEIIVVKNYAVDSKLQFNISEDSRTKLTELFLEKKQDYEVCSVFNIGMDYIRKEYQNERKINLLIVGDDCVLEKHYIKKINPRNELEINSLIGQQWRLLSEKIVSIKPKKGKFKVKLKKAVTNPFKSTIIVLKILRSKFEIVFNIRRIKVRIDNVQESLTKDNRAGGLISFIWNLEEMPNLRYDESFNGNWGFEDCDFVTNLVNHGYYYNKIENIFVEHYKTDWKKEHHDPETAHLKYKDNKNEEYFLKKWKQ